MNAEQSIVRTSYLSRIYDAVKTGSVFLRGIRHSGKTTLLRSIIFSLKDSGVDDDHIIMIDFEAVAFPAVRTAKELKTYLSEKIKSKEKYYIFFDEIEHIHGWEKVVSVYESDKDIRFYITSSHMGSIGGHKKKSVSPHRTEIQISPLSFAEYHVLYTDGICRGINAGSGLLSKAMSLSRNAPTHELYEYITVGGFPETIRYFGSIKNKLADIFSILIYRDVIIRNKIKSPDLLERIIRYIFEHIGEEISTKVLVKSLRESRSGNLNSVGTFIRYLETAFLIYRLRCINLKTMKAQIVRSRYYLGDHALFFGVSDNIYEYGRELLNNVLINELCRRGFEVFYGIYDGEIIDFVALKEHLLLCVQTVSIDDTDENKQQKIKSITSIEIDKKYVIKKYIIYLDKSIERKTSEDTLIHYSPEEFLLNS